MKLIADSGGTKTQWCIISGTESGKIISTAGLNPNFVSEEEFARVLSEEVIVKIKETGIREVWFYGAGCSGEAMELKVKRSVGIVLPGTTVNVHSDLTGAARSMLGKSIGYICMIGTGSNSGYFDGNKIIKNVPPLGFILGDEGSGAYLGKRIIADYLRGLMPTDLAGEFRNQYGAEKDDIVAHVYRGVFPSRFVGGFVKFLKDNIMHEYCQSLIKRSFEEFADRNLSLYGVREETNISVAGSVAWNFRELLEEVLRNHNFRISSIIKEPIYGLIEYHKTN